MDMGVVFEFLRPGGEHAEEADVGAEVFGIGGHGLQGLGSGAEQEIVEEFLVWESQGGEFPRHGEDHVDVAGRQ